MRDPSPHPRIAPRVLVALLFAGGACTGGPGQAPARADIEPLAGSGVSGTVEFTEQPDGEQGAMKVEAKLRGLTPGNHGFHIHQFGDCSAQDGSSAGDHFNPEAAPHGGPEVMTRHAGDLGNVTADAKGEATLVQVVRGLTLRDGPRAIAGRAIIVHASGDDLVSQPSGMSGVPVACGVIRMTSGDTQPVRPDR